MLKIALAINKEYEALLCRARKKLEGRWVRKTVGAGEVTGRITRVLINDSPGSPVKVKVLWKNWGQNEAVDEKLEELREW